MDSNHQQLTDEQVQNWISRLEQYTNVFFNQTDGQNPALWQEAQSKLIQFQKLHDPFKLCVEIIKRSRNQLVLYQATLCLKNAVACDFRKFDLDELFQLFQFLYEFLCSQALENEMSVNETASLVIGMILKRIASRSSSDIAEVAFGPDSKSSPRASQEAIKIEQVITTLCSHIKEPNENLGRRLASAMMLNSLLLESQMAHCSTVMNMQVWRHLAARHLIQTHLKLITETSLETINWAFCSNLLNPLNQTCETQVLFHLVKILIQCVESALSNSYSPGQSVSTGFEYQYPSRLIRIIQDRAIKDRSSHAFDERFKKINEFCDLLMSPSVVQFMFGLYTTVKSMINCVPGWDWPANLLKNCMTCLHCLSDINNSYTVEKNEKYSNFVGNLMLGAIKLVDSETRGVDDIYQIASLLSSISMHTSEARDTITKIKSEHFTPFLDAAQRFTTRVFIHVASTSAEEESEEEKTVDCLLDFWYHLLRNIDTEIGYCASTQPPKTPKISPDEKKGYARMISNCYISCHLHKPLGHVVNHPSDVREIDLENADDQDDNTIHALQLVAFGMIARYDALHTAKLLADIGKDKVDQLEQILGQYINTNIQPENVKEWIMINDDLHWLLLMMQHFLTQTGYGEIGFMCNEILSASLASEAEVSRTLQGFRECDYKSNDVDPIVRLVLIAVKLCQLEIKVCQSDKTNWISSQTNASLIAFLSRFCLTYLFPRESDYSVISENMNHCFGQDSPTAESFLSFIVEHSCCLAIKLKDNEQNIKKNYQFIIQLTNLHSIAKDIIRKADPNSTIGIFLQSVSRSVAMGDGMSMREIRLFVQLTIRLMQDESVLIEIASDVVGELKELARGTNKSGAETRKFIHLCDVATGFCEASDDETSDCMLEILFLPAVKLFPEIIRKFSDSDCVFVAIFDLLYHIVKLPIVHVVNWESQSAQIFYENCAQIIETFAQVTRAKGVDRNDEEDFDDIVALLNFCNEVMKHDWGNSWACCDLVVRTAIEQLHTIIDIRNHMQYPKIRAIYYRLLVYIVDEDERLAHLTDRMLEVIFTSIVVAIESHFDKDTDNHIYTVIGIACRAIYHERGTQLSERLSTFMRPILPLLFSASLRQSHYSMTTESTEMLAPALFALRCCFLDTYKSLVDQLIQDQEDPISKAKITQLFQNLESRIHSLTLNRTASREFNNLFVPLMAELQNYIMVI